MIIYYVLKGKEFAGRALPPKGKKPLFRGARISAPAAESARLTAPRSPWGMSVSFPDYFIYSRGFIQAAPATALLNAGTSFSISDLYSAAPVAMSFSRSATSPTAVLVGP